MAGDRERLESVETAFRRLRAEIAAAHALTRDARVAGDLMRAWDFSERMRLELESARTTALTTTTEPTTAGRE